jgi:anti-sigma factor RsiW
MSLHCPRTEQVQQYLDGELSPGALAAFRDHAAGCDACSAELALYGQVFQSLRELPLWNPGIAFTERVLDRVVPSRLRRRWVNAAGWIYGVASSVTTFLFVSWLARPGTFAWLADRLGEAYVRLIQAGLFTFQAVAFSWLRLIDAWGWMMTHGEHLIPLLRALSLLLGQPGFTAVLTAAALGCVALLWWMRPRSARALEEGRHVGLLGF